MKKSRSQIKLQDKTRANTETEFIVLTGDGGAKIPQMVPQSVKYINLNSLHRDFRTIEQVNHLTSSREDILNSA